MNARAFRLVASLRALAVFSASLYTVSRAITGVGSAVLGAIDSGVLAVGVSGRIGQPAVDWCAIAFALRKRAVCLAGLNPFLPARARTLFDLVYRSALFDAVVRACA